MASIVPPLDFIPKLPGKGVDLISEQLDTLLDQLLDDVSKTVQDSIKLPIDCKCDDPRIKKIKEQLQKIQELITKVQENIPKIQQTIETVKTVITTAQAIKSAITAAQLANPATAGLFIAQQLMAIQDATIVNALASLQQFATLPDSLTAKLTTLAPPLLSALGKVSNACNGDVDNLSLPADVISRIDGTIDYNDQAKTEFYNEFNVSESDLTDRSSNIETLLKQQQDLLTSLLEAPSAVYKQYGIPDPNLGKTGDYYINLDNSSVYGPKVSATQWGNPVNQ
jgi:archaellum component FlaC